MAPPLVIPKHFKHKFFFSNRVFLLIHTSNELDVVIDPTQVKTNLVNSKKQNKKNELNYHFQDLWSNSLGRICIGC
jgi:hypothetical protein